MYSRFSTRGESRFSTRGESRHFQNLLRNRYALIDNNSAAKVDAAKVDVTHKILQLYIEVHSYDSSSDWFSIRKIENPD